MKSRPAPADVPSYIADYPPGTSKLMKQLRGLIRKQAPKADEVISYGMAGYKYHGMLVYFAGYEKHIGFYPGVGAIVAFKKQLTAYKTAKGTVQLPLDEPLPVKLLTDMIKFRVRENEQRLAAKKKK